MQGKLYRNLLLIGCMIGAVSCSCQPGWFTKEDVYNDETNASSVVVENNTFASEPGLPLEAASVYNKRVPPFNSLIVCRSRQCAPAELSTAREYIFNSFAHMIDNNLDETALLCEANPQAHVCMNPYLTIPAKIGVTPAYVFFDGVKIIDMSINKGRTALNLILGYNLSYNGQTPTVCKPDKAMLYVKTNNNVVLNGNGFQCDMTSVGLTTIRVMFNVDYIDLDYGYIGGYYSIGMSGPANGGGNGYGLIRLPKEIHPLSPELTRPVKNATNPVASIKTDIRAEKLNPMGQKNVEPESVASNSLGFNNNDGKEALDSNMADKPVAEVVVKDTPRAEEKTSAYPEVVVKPANLETSNDVKVEDVYKDEGKEVFVEDLDEFIK